MNKHGNKPTVAVMVAVGYKTIIDSLMDTLKEAGVKVKVRTKALDVPAMGIVADLEYDGAIRTKVAMPLKRVLTNTLDDDICTVVLYTFHEHEKYAETSILWSNGLIRINARENNGEWAPSNGRVFISDYNEEGCIVHPTKREALPNEEPIPGINAIKESLKQPSSSNKITITETFCVAGGSNFRGILENNSPLVLWSNGKGDLFTMCPKRGPLTIVDVALGEKGVAARALRNGFDVWTDNNTRVWSVPGTKGREEPKEEDEESSGESGVPEWLARQAMPMGGRRRRKK